MSAELKSVRAPVTHMVKIGRASMMQDVLAAYAAECAVNPVMGALTSSFFKRLEALSLEPAAEVIDKIMGEKK